MVLISKNTWLHCHLHASNTWNTQHNLRPYIKYRQDLAQMRRDVKFLLSMIFTWCDYRQLGTLSIIGCPCYPVSDHTFGSPDSSGRASLNKLGMYSTFWLHGLCSVTDRVRPLWWRCSFHDIVLVIFPEPTAATKCSLGLFEIKWIDPSRWCLSLESNLFLQ